MVPSLVPHTQALAYGITGLMALFYPGWLWRTQGLLPYTPTADQQARLIRGERAIAIGHALFVIGIAAPFIVLGVLGPSDRVLMYLYSAGFVAAFLCLMLWGIGLYLVKTAERWR